MGAMKKVELEVSAETAEALTDERRRMAAARLLDSMMRDGRDDLMRVFAETSERARQLGFTDADLEAELAAYNAERRG